METAISASTFSVVSFIATVASLILAVVAILLSLYFFKLSNALAESTKEAAKEIKSGVERLEKLFDKLYADTFSMMRDTVSDMRKHMWPEDAKNAQDAKADIDKKTEEKLNEFRKEMAKEVASIADRQQKADGKIDATKEELQLLVEKAISGSIEAEREAKEENIKDAILELTKRKYPSSTAIKVVGLLEKKFSLNEIMKALYALKSEGNIIFEGRDPEDNSSPDAKTVIKITDQGRRTLARSIAGHES